MSKIKIEYKLIIEGDFISEIEAYIDEMINEAHNFSGMRLNVKKIRLVKAEE